MTQNIANRSVALDACRAVAVLCVFLHHLRAFAIIPELAGPFANWPLYGMFGVDLFYVLSGYFITQAVLRPASWNPGDFLRARVTRIYPAYLFSLLVVVGGTALLGPREVNYLAAKVLLHVTMLHNFLPGVGGSLNGVYWTLGVEFPYYVVMLGLAPYLRDKQKFWYLSGGMLVLCLLWRATTFIVVPLDLRFFAATQLPGALDAFALGGMVAMFSRTQCYREPTIRWRWVVLAAGIACTAYCLASFFHHASDYWQHWEYVVLWRTGLALSFALIVVACAMMVNSKPLIFSGLPWVGKISFSLYLYHLPVILVTRHFWSEQPLALQLVLCVAITLVSSWLSWRFIERRFHNPVSA